MHHKSLEEISSRMAGIDIAILSTHTENGQIANRPMSNNGDVRYDGTSYYFTFEQALTVADIQANPTVTLGFSGKGGIFSDLDAAYREAGSAEEIEARFSDFDFAAEGGFESLADALAVAVGAQERRCQAGQQERGQHRQQPPPRNSPRNHAVSIRRR